MQFKLAWRHRGLEHGGETHDRQAATQQAGELQKKKGVRKPKTLAKPRVLG